MFKHICGKGSEFKMWLVCCWLKFDLNKHNANDLHIIRNLSIIYGDRIITAKERQKLFVESETKALERTIEACEDRISESIKIGRSDTIISFDRADGCCDHIMQMVVASYKDKGYYVRASHAIMNGLHRTKIRIGFYK